MVCSRRSPGSPAGRDAGREALSGRRTGRGGSLPGRIPGRFESLFPRQEFGPREGTSDGRPAELLKAVELGPLGVGQPLAVLLVDQLGPALRQPVPLRRSDRDRIPSRRLIGSRWLPIQGRVGRREFGHRFFLLHNHILPSVPPPTPPLPDAALAGLPRPLFTRP